jgi:hypothetical protein
MSHDQKYKPRYLSPYEVDQVTKGSIKVHSTKNRLKKGHSYNKNPHKLNVTVLLVFEGPVRSGLLALSAMDRDRNRLTAV